MTELELKARDLLRRFPLIDGHNDLPWALRERAGGDPNKVRLAPGNAASGDPAAVDLAAPVDGTHTDLPRLAAGGVGAQFWSVFVPASFTEDRAVATVLEQIDVARRMIAAYPEALGLALTAGDVERIFADGRIASLLGAEGGHAIAGSLGVLRMVYALGVRYMTLTHNANVGWADSATDEPQAGGLTGFGREVVREMQRIGMLVDLSHVAVSTMHHALDVAQAPVIFSHSSAKAVTDSPRNVPDDVLARLAGNGGMCMVTFVPAFVSQLCADWVAGLKAEAARRGLDPRDLGQLYSIKDEWTAAHPLPRATLAQVADHVEHVREVAGVEHVGLGGDFDGTSDVTVGLEDVSRYPALFAELLSRGWTESDCAALAGGNILRVMRAAESHAVTAATRLLGSLSCEPGFRPSLPAIRHNLQVMASPSPQVRQALKTLQGRIRQRLTENETIVKTIRDTRREPAVELQLTEGQLDAMKAAERVIASDERFEHLAPAEELIQEFAEDCATDRKTDHVEVFMERHGREAIERVCYFGVESLSVKEPAEVAGIRLLPLDDPGIPETNPLFKVDKTITSYAAARVTGTNDVLMAARARELTEHALRVLRIAVRQTSYGLNPQQLRFRLGTSYAFADGGGGWQMHDDVAYPLELSSDLTSVLATAVAGLPPTATKKSINEKALLAVGWLDRAVFTSDPLVATLYRFFALEALLGDTSEGLKNGPLALRQMTLSRIATGYFRHPDDTFLAYKEVRSFAVHGEAAPAVIPEQASHFAWAVRDTLDQYLTVANEHGFTKRRQLLDLLDDYPGRDALIAWIRERGSDEWGEYLDSITASPDAADQAAGGDEEQNPAGPA